MLHHTGDISAQIPKCLKLAVVAQGLRLQHKLPCPCDRLLRNECWIESIIHHLHNCSDCLQATLILTDSTSDARFHRVMWSLQEDRQLNGLWFNVPHISHSALLCGARVGVHRVHCWILMRKFNPVRLVKHHLFPIRQDDFSLTITQLQCCLAF